MEMKTALLRIPAFIIDLVLVAGVIMLSNKIAVEVGLVTGYMPVEALTLVALPLGFFVYWLTGLHLGKRLFGLKVIDAKTGQPPSGFQWFRRCLLFSLVVSINVFLFIPVLVSREQKGFHDMIAGTRVVGAGELADKKKVNREPRYQCGLSRKVGIDNVQVQHRKPCIYRAFRSRNP